MLELNEIYYHPATAEDPILNNISFNTKKGNASIIFGPSGSGKTSLIEIISGLSTPQKGIISIGGKKSKANQRRSISGVVFQFPERHFIGLTILQEMRLGHRKLSFERVNEILEKVGLSDINIKQPPENLSGGQQRRLSIAVQLTRQPQILLLDEPTAGLDWSVRDEIIDIIEKISRNIILIIVTHESKLFKGVDASYYQLRKGRLKESKQNVSDLRNDR